MYYTNLILAVIVLFSSSLPSSWSTDHNTVHSLMGRKKKPSWVLCALQVIFLLNGKEMRANRNIMLHLYHIYLNKVHLLISLSSVHFAFL